jgi:hypothetical protein
MNHTVTNGYDFVETPAEAGRRLAGFKAVCHACGYAMGSTVAFNLKEDMRKHIEYMQRKERG